MYKSLPLHNSDCRCSCRFRNHATRCRRPARTAPPSSAIAGSWLPHFIEPFRKREELKVDLNDLNTSSPGCAHPAPEARNRTPSVCDPTLTHGYLIAITGHLTSLRPKGRPRSFAEGGEET